MESNKEYNQNIQNEEINPSFGINTDENYQYNKQIS